MHLNMSSGNWRPFCLGHNVLTHWGRVTHICVVKLTIIHSDNGLSPGRRQAIIWTNAGIVLIGPLVKNFSEIVIGIQTFSFKKMHLKMSSAKWRPFCLGLNVLKQDKCWLKYVGPRLLCLDLKRSLKTEMKVFIDIFRFAIDVYVTNVIGLQAIKAIMRNFRNTRSVCTANH